MAIPSDLLVGADLVALECFAAGQLRVIGTAPDWLGLIVTPTADGHQAEALGYLEAFIRLAEPFWDAQRTGRLRSGPWSEVHPDAEQAFEASAICFNQRRILIVERLGDEFNERQTILQRAREANLRQLPRQRQVAEQVEAVFAGVPVLLFALNRHGVFTLLEGRGLRSLGLRAEEFIGRDMHEVCLDTPETIAQFEHVIAGHTLSRLIELRGAVLQAWLTPIRAVGGMIDGAVGLAAHITDRIRAQETLEARYQELEAFIYTVSHDLRTPLVSIQGMAGLMAEAIDRGDKAEAHELLGRITANAGRMEQLLADLLTISRVGRHAIPASHFNLGDVIQEVLPDLRRDGLILEQPESWPTLHLPRSLVYQVVANLLGNASKWAGTPPRIRLGLTTNDQTVTLTVDDNGPGVPAHARDHVFHLFAKLEPHSEGSGIGLSIVRRIVEDLGGRVWVEDSTLGGASFRVMLPSTAG